MPDGKSHRTRCFNIWQIEHQNICRIKCYTVLLNVSWWGSPNSVLFSMSAIPSPTTSNPAIDMFSPSHSRCFFEHPDRPDPSISSISMYFRNFKCLKPCISDILSALNPFFSQFVLFFPFQPFRSHSSFPCQPSQSL